jgi:hypothetical protein
MKMGTGGGHAGSPARMADSGWAKPEPARLRMTYAD